MLLRGLQRAFATHRCAAKATFTSQSRSLLTSASCYTRKVDFSVEVNLPRQPDLALRVNQFWLRDHCRCPQCYNSTTKQRNVTPLDIVRSWEKELDSEEAVKFVFAKDKVVRVVWCDGHTSHYDLEWLQKLVGWGAAEDATRLEPEPWTNTTITEAEAETRVAYSEIDDSHTDSQGLKKFAASIIKYGFAIVTDTPTPSDNPSAPTQELCERLANYHPTFYEPFWVFSNKQTNHADTAYTSDALGAHNDSTYYEQAPGLQVFHCLRPATDGGGKTLLVDGLNAALTLRTQDRRAFRFLCKTPVAHRAIESGVHAQTHHLTVIRWNDFNDQLIQFRYNPYDRSPLIFDRLSEQKGWTTQRINDFYRNYCSLSGIVENPANEHWLSLQPGMVLFTDNWRVMHGRSAFTGHREIAGCYLFKEDLLSKARLLRLL